MPSMSAARALSFARRLGAVIFFRPGVLRVQVFFAGMPTIAAVFPLVLTTFVLQEIVTHNPFLRAAEGTWLVSLCDVSAGHTVGATDNVVITSTQPMSSSA